MRRSAKNITSPNGLFGDEQAAELRHELSALQAQVDVLAQQVQSQFTTIAAYAEIARQQADFVRDEARAELARTRETLIGLLETVRRDTSNGGTPTGSIVDEERFAKLEEQVTGAAEAVENCIRRQNELASTMEALLDTVVFSRADQPVLRLA